MMLIQECMRRTLKRYSEKRSRHLVQWHMCNVWNGPQQLSVHTGHQMKRAFLARRGVRYYDYL